MCFFSCCWVGVICVCLQHECIFGVNCTYGSYLRMIIKNANAYTYQQAFSIYARNCVPGFNHQTLTFSIILQYVAHAYMILIIYTLEPSRASRCESKTEYIIVHCSALFFWQLFTWCFSLILCKVSQTGKWYLHTNCRTPTHNAPQICTSDIW